MGARQLPMSNPVADLNVHVLAGQAHLPGLSASASIRDRRVTLTLTNPSLDAALSLRVRFAGGARPTEVRSSVLTHADMRATNSFANPDEVKPATHPARVVADRIELNVPGKAVVLVECAIA